ncbi:hypothetical protein LTSEHVI_0684 [Salmonella enterica subsp. enterica serovar Hvittingfoss str. A4-620]|nr:hypothetical protein LTSEHVI_0684 [Salmonella enterica subsp. enterica serovar Hvittingfoss str. A4-620]
MQNQQGNDNNVVMCGSYAFCTVVMCGSYAFCTAPAFRMWQ